MKNLFFLYLIMFFSTSNEEVKVITFEEEYHNISLNLCPSEDSDTKSIVEDFLTKPYWAAERSETNTTNLSVSQIQVLNDDYDDFACYTFNNKYQEAIDENYQSGGKVYDVAYYRAGSYYFVVILMKQPTDPDLVASGVNYLIVHNSNYQVNKGFAF